LFSRAIGREAINLVSLSLNKGDRAIDKLTDVIILILAILVILICGYPLYFVLIASLSDPTAISTGQVILWPHGFNLDAYKYIIKESAFWLGYKNTIIYTLLSVVFGLGVTIPAGYALSRKDFVGRNVFMMIFAFTMFFNGGLIPTYIIVSKLKLVNTATILIILNCVNVFNIIVTRSYFMGNIPDELFEAASLDGCGNFRFFFLIVLPLSKTIIAVITLYLAVWQWNSYFNALIYATNQNLKPLQLVLRELLVQGQSLSATDMEPDQVKYLMKISQLIKYGLIVLSTLPIICVYPFVQKYFVKGVMIGSVKG
jgi:putative aldouronate transport system permease protein